MRRITVEVVCDQCSNQTSETEAENIEFAIDREVREMDLCPTCLANLKGLSRPKRRLPGKRKRAEAEATEPAWVAAKRRAPEPEPEQPAEARWSCEQCGAGFARKDNLRRHLRVQHGIDLDSKPVRGKARRDLSCPHCDRTGLRPQGLALHMKSAHPQALKEADYEMG